MAMSPDAGSQDLRERLTALLAEEIAPALQISAGDVEVVEIADGVARIRLHGVCASCPSTMMTIVMGIEQELRKRIPEIEYLEAVP